MVAILYKWLLVSGLMLLVSAQQESASKLPLQKVGARLHPFYVSVTEINHNAKDKALEITCRIFADDMESILKQNYKTVVDLGNESRHASNNRFINDYINKHLSLSADGKTAKLQYVGFEKEGASVYCYFEVPNIATVKSISLNNSILQDFTEKQINIIHVTIGGNRKSHKLDYPQKQASFSF
ncbi:MAG: DUF6702 family protein [Chitinophagaceae bacterium]